jgi:hypothetical protein
LERPPNGLNFSIFNNLEPKVSATPIFNTHSSSSEPLCLRERPFFGSLTWYAHIPTGNLLTIPKEFLDANA